MSNFNLFRYSLVWKKNKFSNFLDAGRKPMKQHEDILVFYRKRCTYNPQYTYGMAYERWNSQEAVDRQTNYGRHKASVSKSLDGRRHPISVLEFPRVERPDHPTQKPVELFEYLIKTYSNSGDVVLDSCMGSGTTAVACINTSRHYIGYEIDKGYCEIARRRVKNGLTMIKAASIESVKSKEVGSGKLFAEPEGVSSDLLERRIQKVKKVA